jgi:Outer membrane protein beta-barrel domain
VLSTKRTLWIGLLTTVGVIPLAAQETDESKMFNFNLGGALSVPLNPTGRYFGVSGNVITGAGVNFNQNNAIEGGFMWSGLVPNTSLARPVDTPTGSVNLYTFTGNYRFHIDSIADSPFGFYLIAGGGLYYRRTSISKNYVLPPGTVCQPIYNWWGYACGNGGLVQSVTVSRGNNAGGLNAGAGFTVRVGDPGWKFFVESRYHYAWSSYLPTTLVTVSLGFRFN